ncbi:MAG TPA: nucleoside-diphosphate sugar epimerase, partial [Pseudolabrys sp.]
EAIFRKLRASTGQREFDVRPAPVIADHLVNFARFRTLPVRFSYGQMVFATDRLKNEGFRPRFGLEQFYRQVIGQLSAAQAKSAP